MIVNSCCVKVVSGGITYQFLTITGPEKRLN